MNFNKSLLNNDHLFHYSVTINNAVCYSTKMHYVKPYINNYYIIYKYEIIEFLKGTIFPKIHK